MQLGEKIKKIRKLRNMTQGQLAEKIDASGKHQISLYESGKTVPYADTLIKISKALGVSLDYLLNDDYESENIKFTPQIEDEDLLRKFEILDKFPEKERNLVKEIVDAIIFRNDIKERVSTPA